MEIFPDYSQVELPKIQKKNFGQNQSIGKQIHHLEDILNVSTINMYAYKPSFSGMCWKLKSRKCVKFGNKWNENGTRKIRRGKFGLWKGFEDDVEQTRNK